MRAHLGGENLKKLLALAGLLVIVSLLVVVPFVCGEDEKKPPPPRTPTELPDHFEMDFVTPGTDADRNGDGIIWYKPVHGGIPPPGWSHHKGGIPLVRYVTIDNSRPSGGIITV